MTLKEVNQIISSTTAETVNKIVDANDVNGSFIVCSVKDKITQTTYFVNCVFTLRKEYLYFISSYAGIYYKDGITEMVDCFNCGIKNCFGKVEIKNKGEE